jgi:hypothetical protein
MEHTGLITLDRSHDGTGLCETMNSDIKEAMMHNKDMMQQMVNNVILQMERMNTHSQTEANQNNKERDKIEAMQINSNNNTTDGSTMMGPVVEGTFKPNAQPMKRGRKSSSKSALGERQP